MNALTSLAFDHTTTFGWMDGADEIVARVVAHGERSKGVRRLILRDTAERFWAADMAPGGRVSIVAGPMTVQGAVDLATASALAPVVAEGGGS